MSLLAIGDIHGHSTALRALLAEVDPGPADTLVFLGDYVDKGPDVAGTLEFLIGLGQRRNCIFLRGNHDQMLVDALRDPALRESWESLAGPDALGSYGPGPAAEILDRFPPHHRDFLERTCQLYHETEDFLFVHGGIRESVAPQDEEPERLMWTTLSQALPHYSGKTVICGHTAQESGRIVDLGHTLCIDTGISKGAKLTCLNTGDFTFIQATANGDLNRGRLRVAS